MGLLDQLWDDTVAKPRPDSSLGRLRKPPSIRVDEPDLTSCKASGGGVCSAGPDRVTRTIKIRRPTRIPGVEGTSGGRTGTPPLSPATPPPTSPFAGKETLWFLILD